MQHAEPASGGGADVAAEAAVLALRWEERATVLHEELSSGSYRHGRCTLFRMLDRSVWVLKPESQTPLQPLDTTATHHAPGASYTT